MLLFKSEITNFLINPRITLLVLKRLYSKKQKSNVGTKNALKHFDDFYESIFKNKWPSVRLALHSKNKTVAVLNNYSDVQKTKELLELEGFIKLESLLKSEKQKLSNLKNNNNLSEGLVEKNELESLLQNKLKEEEEKELNYIYPEGMRKSAKTTFVSNENKSTDNETSDDKEYMYDIENSMSSLHADLSAAEIDKSRLIMPDSVPVSGFLNEFIPASQLRGTREYIPESEYYKYYQDKTDLTVKVEKEFDINFPEHLIVYTSYRGDFTEFPSPKISNTGVMDFLEVDGASILPTLALDINPGDAVFYMGHESNDMGFYSIFQTLKFKILVCKENKKVKNVFKKHLFDYSPSWEKMLLVTSRDFDTDSDGDLFDKILIDVPCTDDRLCLFEEENNLFSPHRLKDRLQLPQLQTKLLVNALKLVRSGGTVVYSTSTLSPVQNDRVVIEALRILWEEFKMQFIVKDLSSALAHFSLLFNFGNYIDMKYGTLVVPFTPSNFGPKYFCKIVKSK